MRRPRFEWSFNFGHVMQAVTMCITMIVFVWYMAQTTAEFRHAITSLNDRTSKLAPAVEALLLSQGIQKERIDNLSLSIKEVKDSNVEIRAKIGTIREDITGIKARLGN